VHPISPALRSPRSAIWSFPRPAEVGLGRGSLLKMNDPPYPERSLREPPIGRGRGKPEDRRPLTFGVAEDAANDVRSCAGCSDFLPPSPPAEKAATARKNLPRKTNRRPRVIFRVRECDVDLTTGRPLRANPRTIAR
jgi:hypothetical protein